MTGSSDKGNEGWETAPSFLRPGQGGQDGPPPLAGADSFAPESFGHLPGAGGEASFVPAGAGDFGLAASMTGSGPSFGPTPSFSGGPSTTSDADIGSALYGSGSPGSGGFTPDASSFTSSQGSESLGNLAGMEAAREGSWTETTPVPSSFDKGGDSFGSGSDFGADGFGNEAAGEGSFTETRSVSWFDKIQEAIGGVVIGLILVVAMGFLLFWNEGRAVQTSRSLDEGAGLVHDVPSTRVDPANEGKLVHLQGELGTATPLSDQALGMQVRAARLVRTVEMFQWKEESRTETHKRVGGGEDRVTTYTYTRVWSDHRNESERFHNQSGHSNPQMRYSRFETAATDASLGAFRPGTQVLERLPADRLEAVGDETLSRLRGRVGTGPSSIVDGRLYLGQDAANPRVGDLRVTYHVAPLGNVSFIGRQTGSDIQEYYTKAGDRLLLARSGLVPADAMFARAQAENNALTWILRAVGAILMWVGFLLILRPIAVLGDVVPIVGTVLGAGAALAAFLLTLVVAPLVIGLAWLFYRPLVGIAFLLAGGAAVYGIRHLAHQRAAARSGPPPLAAARA